MKPSKARMDLAALRRAALDDLRETPNELLRQEALADGEDLDAVADRMKSRLLAAVSEVHPSCEGPPPAFGSEGPPVRRARWRQWGVAVALVTLGAITIDRVVHRPGRTSATYETALGESRTVVLPDGSTVILNTNSRLTWEGTNRDRRIQLERGEVLFEIARDKARPFSIHVALSDIRVLGTEFVVYRKADGTIRVTVLEGVVSIQGLSEENAAPSWARTLTRNEQIEYADRRLLRDVHPTKATDAVAWRDGLLKIENGTVGELVTELNRYSALPIILAHDPRLERRSMTVTALLTIRNLDDTLKALQLSIPGLKVSRRDNTIVLSYLPDPQQPRRPHNAGQP